MKQSAVLLLFFFSGAVGVAYEVVWARQLSLLFGVSIYAVSAVLVAFMGGLGLGAEYFGRMLNRGFSPVRLYAVLEVGVGVYVLLFPLWYSILEKAYLFLHPGTEGVSAYVIAIRFTLAVTILIIPTSLMGGTLPALAKFFSASKKESGSLTGILYAVNTLGAMAGCVAAGFWMVEHLGLTNTLRVGAVINILAGILVWFIAGESEWRKEPAVKDDALRTAKSEETQSAGIDEKGRKNLNLLTLVFGISGFCALALEVLWTRMFTILLNNTTYAFSLILAIFLLGIGAGSAAVSTFHKKMFANGRAYFGIFQIGIGVFALLSLVALGLNRQLIEFIEAVIGGGGGGLFSGILPGGEQMTAALIFSLLIVLPCTFLMGGGFPLVVQSVSIERKKLAGDVGRLYAVNIIGCVLGSVAAGFLLIPLIGVQKGLILVSWVAVSAGTYLLFKVAPEFKKATAATALGLALPLTVILFLKSDVAYLLSFQKLDAGSEVEFYEEGPSASVLVSSQESDMTIGRKPIKRIWINGDPIAGVFREALQLERLQAHIPLMLMDNPKNAVVICFGTGTTAGASAAHSLDEVIAVDISPEVFNAGTYFADGNFNIMQSPALKLVEEDGRNFLLTTKRKFDLITSEPPPPSNAGIVSLYTTEYYRLAKRSLKKGGLVSQWIPLHHLSEEDFRMLVSSFIKVFPEAQMWYTKWDAIMIGGLGDISILINNIKERFADPAIAASLKDIGVTNAYQLLSNYMMGPDELRAFVADTPPLSDDRPVVEFTAPRILREGVTIKGANLRNLLIYRAPPKIGFESEEEEKKFKRYFDSQGLFLEGQFRKNYGHNSQAAVFYNRALQLNPDNADAKYALISLNLGAIYAAASRGKKGMGLRMVSDSIILDTEGWFAPQLHFLNGILYAASGGRAMELAVAELRKAIKLDERYFMAIVNLAGLYATELDRPDRAKALYEKALLLKSSKSERDAVLKALERL